MDPCTNYTSPKPNGHRVNSAVNHSAKQLANQFPVASSTSDGPSGSGIATLNENVRKLRSASVKQANVSSAAAGGAATITGKRLRSSAPSIAAGGRRRKKKAVKTLPIFDTNPMSDDEKSELAEAIIKLPDKKLEHVFRIIECREPDMCGSNPNELTIDLAEVKLSTLRELEIYVSSP